MRGQALIRRLGPLAVMAALVLPYACATLVLPFGRDQGIYAYTADRFLQGDTLYRDIYVFKPPMTVFVHALSQVLFGRSMMSIRALDVLWTLATGVALYAFMRTAFRHTTMMGSRWAGIAVGLAYAILYHHTDWWNSAQTDGWATLPTAIGLTLVFTRTERPTRLRYLAGLAIGTAFLFKYTLGCLLPLAMGLLWLLGGREGFKQAWILFGGFLTSVVGLIVAMALDGGLPSFVSSQLEVLVPYAGAPKAGRNWASAWGGVWRMLPDGMVVAALAGIGIAILALLWRLRSREDGAWREVVAWTAALGWLTSSTASLVAQGKFFPYHYLPLLAPMGILAVVGVARVLDLLPARVRPWLGGAAVLGMFVASGFGDPFPGRWKVLSRLPEDHQAIQHSWVTGKYRNRDMALADDQAMADWLRAHTKPDDRVFLWSYDPMIYFLADRRLVSRFPYTYPVAVAWGPDAYDQELLDALIATPPVVFVVSSHDATPPVMGHRLDSVGTFEQSGPIRDFVLANYEETALVNKRFHVYVRKSTDVSP